LFRQATLNVFDRLRSGIASKNVKRARKAKAGKGWA
jgi:hypothetical protein